MILASNTEGAETVITGKVNGGKGLTVRLMTYSDHISYLRHTLAYCVVDEMDSFRLTADLTETIYGWLDIEFNQGDIYLQPGQRYEVHITYDPRALSSSYYDRPSLSISFIKDDPDRLNLFLRDFNGIYNDFLLNYASGRNNQTNANAFQAFKTAIDLRFKNAPNSYFKSYVSYKTAAMEMFLRLKSRDKIGLEYLAGEPLLLNNIEYMEFFQLYFEKYFLTGNNYFNYNKTYDLINGKASLDSILDSLKIDPVLQGEEIRELLLLSGLKELYGIAGFDRPRILGLVDELARAGSSTGIMEIAGNLLIRFNRLKPGTPAPDFTLPAPGQKKVFNLSDFKGSFVYLAFFDSRNPASQAEMGLVSEWHEEVADKVRFVAISVDRDPAVISGNPNISPEVWTILHYNGNLELLESYDALAVPYFILIDGQGLIKSCPALSPSENILEILNAI